MATAQKLGDLRAAAAAGASQNDLIAQYRDLLQTLLATGAVGDLKAFVGDSTSLQQNERKRKKKKKKKKKRGERLYACELCEPLVFEASASRPHHF